MNFNKHSSLVGQHAIIGASKYHWINYSDDKMTDIFRNMQAVQRGIELHDFAERCIRLGQKLPKSRATLNMYVNDAVGYHMAPEQVLYFSDNCFGTADAISFNNGLLRIHDLKTGATPAHMEQLLIYTALFCLEYGYKPIDISAELRIYQNDDVQTYEPTVDDILPIMDKIRAFDKLLNRLKADN